MPLHYLLKLKIRVFVNTLMLEKHNSRNVTYWLWFCDKNILMCFSVQSSSCCLLPKREYYALQGRVETLFKWGGKRLHFCTTYLLRTTYRPAKFYHNRSGFV